MQRAEARHSPSQNRPDARQGKGAGVESPQGEQIAQLEAMAENSPQTDRQAQLGAMANASPVVAAQRKLADMVHNSPPMVAQRKAVVGIHDSTRLTAQRQTMEEPLQAETAQRAEAPAKPNHTGLPDNLKSGIESLSGMSMDNVKVHYNSSQPAQLNALAYAQGTDIHVAPGQEQHLPHEAWHVVQQAQGKVRPTMQMKNGVPVNDDKGLESEADVMGAKAMQLTAREIMSTPTSTTVSRGGLLQLFNIGWVPSNPANYRGVTNVVGNSSATSGGTDFGFRRYTVEGNNVANAAGGGGVVAIPAGNMISDVGGAILPTYTQARNISPECDHIVPVSEFGANDLENARMVSKAQNTGGGLARPPVPPSGGVVGGAAGVALRLYTPIAGIQDATTGAPISPGIPTGTNLTFLQAQSLSHYATGAAPANWNGMTNMTLGAIQASAVGTNNGITVF